MFTASIVGINAFAQTNLDRNFDPLSDQDIRDELEELCYELESVQDIAICLAEIDDDSTIVPHNRGGSGGNCMFAAHCDND